VKILDVNEEEKVRDRVCNLEFLMEDLFMDERIKLEHDKIRQARELVKLEQQKKRELDGITESTMTLQEKRSTLAELRERVINLETENEFLRVRI
jgi:hypothetical protein